MCGHCMQGMQMLKRLPICMEERCLSSVGPVMCDNCVLAIIVRVGCPGDMGNHGFWNADHDGPQDSGLVMINVLLVLK